VNSSAMDRAAPRVSSSGEGAIISGMSLPEWSNAGVSSDHYTIPDTGAKINTRMSRVSRNALIALPGASVGPASVRRLSVLADLVYGRWHAHAAYAAGPHLARPDAPIAVSNHMTAYR